MVKPDFSTLGKRLHWARKARGMTLRAVGQLADLDYSVVARIEYDQVKETAGIVRLADALGVNVYWLHDGRGEPEMVEKAE